MIQELSDLPDGVIGVEISGKIEADDYGQVLLPLVQRAVDAGTGIRIVIVMHDFDGISMGALRQDMKLGVGHLGDWKRTAVVTDIDWVRHSLAVFGWLTPGEVKQFALDERDAATAWAAG